MTPPIFDMTARQYLAAIEEKAQGPAIRGHFLAVHDDTLTSYDSAIAWLADQAAMMPQVTRIQLVEISPDTPPRDITEESLWAICNEMHANREGDKIARNADILDPKRDFARTPEAA